MHVDALFGHFFLGNIYPRINNQQALRAKLMIFPEYSIRLVENTLAVTRWPMHDFMSNKTRSRIVFVKFHQSERKAGDNIWFRDIHIWLVVWWSSIVDARLRSRDSESLARRLICEVKRKTTSLFDSSFKVGRKVLRNRKLFSWNRRSSSNHWLVSLPWSNETSWLARTSWAHTIASTIDTGLRITSCTLIGASISGAFRDEKMSLQW